MAEIKTDERPASKARDEIIREAKRLEESTLYSFKGHHCAARGWTNRHLWLGIPTVIISAIIGAAAFSQYTKEYTLVGIIAGFMAIAVAILSGVTTFLNPNDKESAHISAAHAFDKLNGDSRLFWSIECWQEPSDEVLTSQLRELVDRRHELNSSSPQIPPWAYKEAKAGIEAGEASFEVDRAEKPQALPKPGDGPRVEVLSK
jgi:D-aminopeptidase